MDNIDITNFDIDIYRYQFLLDILYTTVVDQLTIHAIRDSDLLLGKSRFFY